MSGTVRAMDERVQFTLTLPKPIHDRVLQVVSAMNQATAGLRATRQSVVEDVLGGQVTLAALEQKWLRPAKGGAK